MGNSLRNSKITQEEFDAFQDFVFRYTEILKSELPKLKEIHQNEKSKE